MKNMKVGLVIPCNINNLSGLELLKNHRLYMTSAMIPVFRLSNKIVSAPNTLTKPHKLCLTTKLEAYHIKNVSILSKLQSNVFNPTFDSSNFDKIVSHYKAECDKQEWLLTSQLRSEIIKADQTSNKDWDAIRNFVLEMNGSINDKNIDAVIMNKCSELKSLSLGKSYFKYLKNTTKLINRATYGSYLRLFYSCVCDCTNDDLIEIENVYEELLEVHPLLDCYTAEKAICALSLTDKWREYKNLFQTIRKFYNPSQFTYAVVIKTAFDNQEIDLGWELMEEMQYQGTKVPDDVFNHWLRTVKKVDANEAIEKVLKFLCHFNIKPSLDLCEMIKKVSEEWNQKSKGIFTSIARNGECRHCHSKLEPTYVSENDYDELKEAFLNPVLIGKDIFQKTQPEEFDRFLKLLEKSGPFNVVIDGLNVALKCSKRQKSVAVFTFQLKSVVEHFVVQNKKVLVLGRKHMAKWRSLDMDYVYENAHMFLADNLSQDDPFMLYAALYSGLGTCFVSQDMMRGHKFLLAKPNLQMTFQKWQSQHQYFISYIKDNGSVYFQEPVSFLQSIQQNFQGDWHIPYSVKEELTDKSKVDHLHKHWLCLQNNAKTEQKISQSNSTYNIRQKETNTNKYRPEMWNSRPKKKGTSVAIKKLFQD